MIAKSFRFGGIIILVVLFYQNPIFSQANQFRAYRQEITGSNLIIEMVPIPEGVFAMGSPENSEGQLLMKGPPTKWAKMLFINRTVDDYKDDQKAGEVAKQVDAIADPTIP